MAMILKLNLLNNIVIINYMTEKTIEQREQKISDQIKVWTPEEVAIIKETVAKGFTDLELSYFLNVAKFYKLNPFTKEIWAYRDLQNNIIIFAGRDGFLALAQKDKHWNGIASCEVREGEEFELDIALGEISHRKDVTSKAKILGAYAICRPKDCQITTIEWADFDTYNKGRNVWKTDPAAMIKKVAEVHALKKAYGISGLQAEEDFNTDSGQAITIDHEFEPDKKTIGYADNLIHTSTYDHETQAILEKKIWSADITNIELERIISELQMNQPKKY
jgi:phage recombination protein Bet